MTAESSPTLIVDTGSAGDGERPGPENSHRVTALGATPHEIEIGVVTHRWVLGVLSDRDTAVLAAADEALDVDDWAQDSWWDR